MWLHFQLCFVLMTLRSFPRSAALSSEAVPLRTEKPLPFMMLYTTSVGSSWLMNELSQEPSICCIGNEPLDDTCGERGKSSGNSKRQLGWLKVALTPPTLEQYSDLMGRRMGRGDAYKAAWRLWKLKLVQHALPCKAEEIRKSFEEHSCDGGEVRVYGFKTNLFSGSMLSDRNKGKKWDIVKEEFHQGKIRIIRLKRRNILEQALNVYWKSQGGFGILTNKKGMKRKTIKEGGRAISYKSQKVENFEKLDQILNTLKKKETLLDQFTTFLNLPTLTIFYEDLKNSHRNTIRKLSQFLSVKINSMNDFDIDQQEFWNQDESRTLCTGIENYGEFCLYYSKSLFAEYLTDPCAPGVWDCCKCKPMSRMVFPGEK